MFDQESGVGEGGCSPGPFIKICNFLDLIGVEKADPWIQRLKDT